MKNEKIKVQLSKPERYFSKNYHDFMDCSLLNGEEKITFLALKRFLDVKSDNGKVFPTIEKIQEMTGWGNQKVVKYIKSLVKKGGVKKIRQGLSKPNLYIILDEDEMWKAKNIEELKKITEESELEKAMKIIRDAGYIVTKERELASGSDQTTDTSTQNKQSLQEQNTTPVPKSQELERYTLDQIKQLFDYDIMIQDNPYRQQEIDSVMDILHTTMNTTKATIRISGENKSSMVVIGKLMKLNKESIIYAINKFSEQTDRIKNPTAYMLTILYNAPEQFNLDIQNRIQYDQNKQIKGYSELEKQLLG